MGRIWNASLEPLVLFLSFLSTFSLLYFRFSSNLLMPVLSLGAAALLVLFSLMYQFKNRPKAYVLVKYILIFLASLLVQLLVFSSGGFLSPFLILIHIFFLGASFLLGLVSALVFLFLSFIALALHIYLFPSLYSENLDPWVAGIYIISLFVIVPLAIYINRTYRVNNAFSSFFREKMLLGQKRESQILTGLSDIVVLTDTNLSVLTVNSAAEIYLGITSNSVIGQPFLKVIPLRNEKLTEVRKEDLALDKVINTRPAIPNDFYLVDQNMVNIQKVSVQVRPIEDLGGKIIQFVFLITNLKKQYQAKMAFLEPLRQKQQKAIKELEDYFTSNHLGKLIGETKLIERREEDLFLTSEIDQNPLSPTTSLCYLINICRQQINNNQDLASSLGVSSNFNLPSSDPELRNQYLEFGNLKVLTNPGEYTYSVLSDPKWLPLLINKLLELSILLSSRGTKGVVSISVDKEGSDYMKVIIQGNNCPIFIQPMKEKLFEQYYPGLGKDTNLGLGSGLEGYLAKKIADGLKLKIEAVFTPPYYMSFILKIPKNPFKA